MNGIEGDDVQGAARTMQTIKKRIQEELNHPFLREQLQPPKEEEDKLCLHLCMPKDQRLSKEQIETYATTVALIQIALDTHDRVENGNSCNEKMQLTVLAGDYFSSLYYHTLARIENIDFIKQLAGAIQLVNEHKMIVYNREVKTFDAFMDSMKSIVATVYQKTAEYFQDRHWQQFGTKWLHYQHLIANKTWYIDYLLENEIPVASADITEERIQSVEKRLAKYVDTLDEKLNRELSENPHFKNLRKLFREIQSVYVQ